MGTLGRFQLLTGRPIKHPGKCLTCGSSNSKDYVDFGIAQEIYGVVYICIDCFRAAAAELLNLVPVEKYNLILSEVSRLKVEKNEIRSAWSNTLSLLDSMRGIGPPMVDSPGVAEDTEKSTGTESVDPGNEQESNGSVDESRSTNVRDYDSVDELLESI